MHLRQHFITALCYVLRVPFAILDALQRPFTRRARRHPQSILLIKPCCLGDLIMTTPLVEVIHRAYPHATITYVAGTWSKVIPEHLRAVTYVIDSGSVGIPGHYSLHDYRKLVSELRRYRFDLAFVLDRSPMITLLPWLAGIPRRVGPDSLGRGFSLTNRVPVSTSPTRLQHQAEVYLDLARAIGLPVNHPRMHFLPTDAERQTVSNAGNTGNPTRVRVAILPGGGSNPGMQLTAKRWPLQRYQELTERLVRELDAEVLLIGGPDDADLNQQLLDGLHVPAGRVINLAGKTTIGELAAQLERCTLFIGNDSSPMHLAAAVAIPVIAIFGPTSPQEYGPYPPDDAQHVALWKNPNGQPCFFLGKMRPHHNCTCIQAITVNDVWEAVQRFIPVTQNKEVAQ